MRYLNRPGIPGAPNLEIATLRMSVRGWCRWSDFNAHGGKLGVGGMGPLHLRIELFPQLVRWSRACRSSVDCVAEAAPASDCWWTIVEDWSSAD